MWIHSVAETVRAWLFWLLWATLIAFVIAMAGWAVAQEQYPNLGAYSGSYLPPQPGPNAYRPPKDISDWFESLKRPEDSLDKATFNTNVISCCDVGDAYPIEILEEATSERGDEIGVARVTDPSQKEIAVQTAEGGWKLIYRTKITGDGRFNFRGDLVVKQKYGNPTKTAWAFLYVNQSGQIDHVYCIVPLPPSY